MTRADEAIEQRLRDNREGHRGLPEEHPGPANDDEILVRVTVTNEDEPGEISILQRQPQVGVELEGMASDPDDQDADGDDVTVDFDYEWSVAKVVRPVIGNNNHWVAASGANTDADYTPTSAEEGSVLRLKVRPTRTHRTQRAPRTRRCTS